MCLIASSDLQVEETSTEAVLCWHEPQCSQRTSPHEKSQDDGLVELRTCRHLHIFIRLSSDLTEPLMFLRTFLLYLRFLVTKKL